MMSVGDVMRYVPGVSVHQGENNRDQIIIRGNSSSADFYIDGVRDDVQYYRDLYNVERIEALKGPNAMIFGRGGAGGVVNRVMKSAGFQPLGELSLQGGMNGHKRATADVNRALHGKVAFRANGMFEDSGSFRHDVTLHRKSITPTVTCGSQRFAWTATPSMLVISLTTHNYPLLGIQRDLASRNQSGGFPPSFYFHSPPISDSYSERRSHESPSALSTHNHTNYFRRFGSDHQRTGTKAGQKNNEAL